MANPNVVAVSSIYANTAVDADVAASAVSLLTAASNKLLKINSIIVANIDGSSSADVTVSFYDSSATARYKIASTVAVPADSTLVVIGKDSPIYLAEGDQIEANASNASDLEMIISFEELDDA